MRSMCESLVGVRARAHARKKGFQVDWFCARARARTHVEFLRFICGTSCQVKLTQVITCRNEHLMTFGFMWNDLSGETHPRFFHFMTEGSSPQHAEQM